MFVGACRNIWRLLVIERAYVIEKNITARLTRLTRCFISF